MKTRDELSKILNSIPGVKKVYFGKPSKGMVYPCILYSLEGQSPDFADNVKYRNHRRWTLILIDENPDSLISKELEKIPYCNFDRPYYADGLNHFVYTLYF